MFKCPECKSTDTVLIYSSEDYSYEQWECVDCGFLLDVEEGIITVQKPIGFNEFKIMYKVTTEWEKVL